MPAIADDSGLVVPALNGAPGIYSARYAGSDADSQANIRKLLLDLERQPGIERWAYFFCAVVLLDSEDDPAPLVATARWHGRILMAPQGVGGFGYDPVFAVGDTRRSAAELDADEKQQVRGMQDFVDKFKQKINWTPKAVKESQ